MKSAYEAALERLEAEGIQRPDTESLSSEDREQIAEVHRRTEAKLAELKILHQDRLRKTTDPASREEEKQSYREERERIQAERERQLEELRSGS